MSLSTITPVARLEIFLQDIADGKGTPTEDPVSRPEEFLHRIAESNGEQDAALEHIADQIPLDPESTDVGKVMTVVADTSGEEPVYKWSAEEAPGGLLSLIYDSAVGGGTTTPYGTGGPTQSGVTGWDDFSADFEALKSDYQKLNEYIDSHIHFYFCGIRVHFRASANLADSDHTVNGEKVVLPWLCKDASNNAVVVTLAMESTIRSNLAVGTYAIHMTTKAYDQTGTQITSGITNASGLTTNYKLLVYR